MFTVVFFFFLAKYEGRNHFQIKKRENKKSNKILMNTKR